MYKKDIIIIIMGHLANATFVGELRKSQYR